MKYDEDDGFYVPLHRSLTEPILIGGVPKGIALLNGTICSALLIGLSSFWPIGVGVFVHLVFAYFTRKDPQWFEILKIHLKEKDRYDP